MERFDTSLVAGRYPRYQGNVIRPANEADSLILQVMYGCSYGKCSFCGSYTDKAFRLRPVDAVVEDVEGLAESTRANMRRVFLCDGDALALPTGRMTEILDALASNLPSLARVSAYANTHSLMRLSDEELREIRAHGLELLYVGLESGDNDTLSRNGKGLFAAQIIEALRRAKDAGFALSLTVVLGLAGEKRSMEHARATGEALSAIDPDYIELLSLTLEPGTRAAEQVRRGDLVVPGPYGLLRELREIIAGTNVTHAVFRTNLASDYLVLAGTLPEDKAGLLEAVDQVLAMAEAVPLRPEAVRAL
jgi:radical SAM superfamily enzyme YgiQ (UPF0313 family)